MTNEEKLANKLGMSNAKWRVFLTAVELFFAKGYSNTSVRDIAAALGMKAGSIYSHFESKDAILSQIYKLCEEQFDKALPDLDALLAMVPTEHPHEILDQAMLRFDEDLGSLIPMAMRIIIEESHRDPRAKKIVNKIYVDTAEKYLGTLLEKMIELGRIEPLRVDLFVLRYARYELGAAYSYTGKSAHENFEWEKVRQPMREFVYSVLQVKE
jgi:AcrR family transcriptional regulator